MVSMISIHHSDQNRLQLTKTSFIKIKILKLLENRPRHKLFPTALNNHLKEL